MGSKIKIKCVEEKLTLRPGSGKVSKGTRIYMPIEDQVIAPVNSMEKIVGARLIWEEVNLLATMVRGATAKRYRTRYGYRVCGGEKDKTHIVVSSYIEPECSKNGHG